MRSEMRPSRDMGYSMELKMSSRRQQTSKILKEKVLSPRENQNLKFQDKRKAEIPFGQPYINKHETNIDDELVKHMSNLPGYLQHVERGEKLQEKALNFGVLDWERLEKWKYTEKRIPIRGNMKASSSTNSITAQTRSLTPRKKQPILHGYHHNSSYEERPSGGKVMQLQDFKTLHRRNYSEIMLDRGKRKESDQMTTLEKETSLSDWRKHGLPRSILDTTSSQAHQPIVLLLPKHSPKRSFSESCQLSESRISCDGKSTEINRRRYSECFSPEELHSVKLYPEISHSCPLPVGVAERHSCESNLNIEDPSGSSTSKKLDEDISEQVAAKARHPSPNRRFSFSLSKMTRSLSLKEGSGVTQLSPTYATVKSDPIRSEGSAGLDSFSGEKPNSCNRSRSSPLRRLLDPLLKPKGAHSAETAHPSKVHSDSVSELPQNKKHESSSIQALLQIIIKNGLPLFKLVVDNSSDILAASVKKSPRSEKDNSTLIYAFYSVHEIKKKIGGWINQGSKGKACGFGYNMVGQMKVSSSYVEDQSVVRESILYSVDPGQTDKETPELVPYREVAAIVVKDPSEKNDGGDESDKNIHYTPNGFAGENANPKSTVVILPGGIHGLPTKGVPSPLITRWRSGGSCDCGGWDVGCKLRVITDQDQSRKIRPSMSCSTSDRLELFVQDGHQEKKPIFSLAPFKNGLYSVEYNSSISSLQAFSICVAVIESPKSSDIFEVHNNLSEEKRVPKLMSGSGPIKPSSAVQGEVQGKYGLSPPPSPFGRV